MPVQHQKWPAVSEAPLQKPRLEPQGVLGRDLKESRHKRGLEGVEEDIRCLNDPLCEEKFSRDPVSDSLVERDFAKYLKVGQRSLLNSVSDIELDANLTKKSTRAL